jgi:hypothetical protein
LILKTLGEFVPKLGAMPKTALIVKIQEILQENDLGISDNYNISSVVDLLYYEELVFIEDGANRKQYCLLPKHMKGRK